MMKLWDLERYLSFDLELSTEAFDMIFSYPLPGIDPDKSTLKIKLEWKK